MVYEAGLVSQTSSVNGPLAVEIKQKGEVLPVIYNAATIGFKKGDYL